MPLEYEVAKLLVRHGFSVTADYPYQRTADGQAKEFSVDLHAFHLLPYVASDEIEASLSLLVECKFRHPGASWLFLPDPNAEYLGFATDGGALRAIDVFSAKFFYASPSAIDDCLVPCYKGLEIDTSTGAAYDAELRHGLSQLQYAVPAFLADRLQESAVAPSLANSPFLFSPVLVTNAPLIVAHKKFDTHAVQHARNLRHIGRKVPYLSVYIESWPDFRAHVRTVFSFVPDLLRSGAFRAIDEARLSAGAAESDTPAVASVSLSIASDHSFVGRIFKQLIVCNTEHFGTLLRVLKREATRLARTARSEPKIRRQGAG